MKTAIFCHNEYRAPALSWAFACLLLNFHILKYIFKLTIDISVGKIMLEVEYFIKSMICQMLKFFKRTALLILYPEMTRRPLFC